MRTTPCLRRWPVQIKARLGGRVRIILSGGAPLPEHISDFLRVAMCVPVVQVGVRGGAHGTGGGRWEEGVRAGKCSGGGTPMQGGTGRG